MIKVDSWGDIIKSYNENKEGLHRASVPVKFVIELYNQVQELKKEIDSIKNNATN